jgi:hypothetical protein
MKDHLKRLNNISRFALPPIGTPAYEAYIENYEKKDKDDPAFKKFIKESSKKAFAIANIQNENGAGLPIDIEIRHFLREFNFRNWEHGLRSMPTSFNILEGLFTYRPDIQLFELLEEEDYLFNFYDYIDFITSTEFKEDSTLIKENLVDDLIYNYNITNLLEDITFTTENGGIYVIGGISIVKRGNEAIVFLLTGEMTDTKIATQNLTSIDIDTKPIVPEKSSIKIAEGLSLEAVKLFEKENIWKTLAFCRVDLERLTIDTRYIQKDIGVAYTTITDDLSGFVNNNGEFLVDGLKETFEKLQEEIVYYAPLFEVAVKCLYLPLYFNKFEDSILEEEHETIFGSQKQRKAIFKKDKIVQKNLLLKSKTVWRLERNTRKFQDKIYFGESDFKIERKGYWKNLEYNSVGKDKNGKEIIGRTWVDTIDTWYEKDKQTLTVNVKTSNLLHSANPKQGSIYIMRNASHAIDLFKIGLTTRDSKSRAKELSSTTGTPDKFLIANEWEVVDCILAEKLIHQRLDEYRVNDKREFFKLDYKLAMQTITEVVKFINERKIS